MTTLRRVTHLAGIASIAALAVLLILEATEAIDQSWRLELSDAIERAAFPTWPLWASGLAGAGLAALGVALIAAQFAPPKRGLNTMHEIFRSSDGDTNISGRSAIRAAQYELSQIEGVLEVIGTIKAKTLLVELQVDDRANVAAVENEARERLGHEFWINLGLADFTVNVLITHHPKPPRTR